MRTSQEAMLHQILYRALAEPVGLLLATDDPVRARQKLYHARYMARDTELAVLRIKISTIEGGQLMIYRQEALDALAPPPMPSVSPKGSGFFDVADLDDLSVGPEDSK